jgi:serine/threonine protein kinase
MEYLAGPSLEDIIKTRTVPIAWAVSLLSTVARAVEHAHNKGIVHRDLKPGNIVLHDGRRPVVMDFGIAKFTGKASNLTQQGVIMGTPAYMPPEQAGEDLGPIGPYSDVYSLGAIFYTLLTGHLPFDEGSAVLTLLKVVSPTPPPRVREFRPDVPARLEQICMKCLAKAPADRYPTAHALGEDLRRYRAEAIGKLSSLSLKVTLPTVALEAAAGGKQMRLFQARTVIGRAPDCDLVLKVAAVSKRHCEVRIEADQVVVEDLGSVNGTCVNGRPVQVARLQDGDELDVAGHIFTVRLQTPKD